MVSFHKAAGLIGILVTVSASASGLKTPQVDSALREGRPVLTELSANSSAMAYWVSEPDGWHVVTTVDTLIGRVGDAEQHAVARFSSVILPGQSQLISVPAAIGERQQVLRVRRLRDQIDVALLPGST
jgi:hypothetical protein